MDQRREREDGGNRVEALYRCIRESSTFCPPACRSYVRLPRSCDRLCHLQTGVWVSGLARSGRRLKTVAYSNRP
jgi:hypothetical protein